MKLIDGFSLVEVIITITLIGVIGVISVTILTRTYRATSQSDTTSNLKQNGDMALNSIIETLRNAEGVACYSADVPRKSMVVRTLNGQYTKFRFVDPVTGQNGYIVKQENLNAADFANFCTSIIAGEVAITNRQTSGGVSITDGEFTRIPGSGGKDLVTISFNVNPSLTTGGTGTNIFPMRTTIQIR